MATRGPASRSTYERPPLVRRAPFPLARRFLQICTAVVAEPLASEGLMPLDMGVLAYLNQQNGEPDIDQNGLAARLGIDRYSASLLVERLEKEGIVDRRVNGADRRARLLRLTARGERLYARLRAPVVAKQMALLAPLSTKEQELFLDFLVRIVEANHALARPGAGRRKPVRRAEIKVCSPRTGA
ncbi:MAG TPA: MarR family transcriptional regulator [Bradyrhizobium sp.]|uniref:MarR family winged helix-turn-helix transcriptional regulator n=1 Tax=Bradyrhizobium sp. TaxID=376 RepID=UPI002B49B547|nr:MarR family transcriptional regulator [Bradyrhizobium sp.]HKO72996.1 MarR family transcriptional regulator [Bradyrhizobium sp.]